MNFSTNNFDIVTNNIPKWWLNVGIPCAVVGGIVLFVLIIFAITILIEEGIGRDDLLWGGIIMGIPALLVAFSITGVVMFNNHDASAKQQTLSNVSKWADNKYGVDLDAVQAGRLVSNGDDKDKTLDDLSWSTEELKATSNVSYLGETSIATKDHQIVKVKLMKLNTEWFLIDASKKGAEAELPRR